MNRETIIDTLWWYKILPLSGVSPIRVKQKLHKRLTKLEKSSSSRRRNQGLYTDNSWEFGKSCGEWSWSHRTSTPYRSETNGNAKEQYEKWRKEPQPYGYSQDWMKNSGLILDWFYRMLMQFAKCPRLTGGLENSPWKTNQRTLSGTTVSFEAMVEYHPISTKDQSRLQQSEKKVLPGIFFRIDRRMERRYSDCWYESIGISGSIRDPLATSQCKEVLVSQIGE